MNFLSDWIETHKKRHPYRTLSQSLHLDWSLVVGLLVLTSIGLIIFYSGSDQNFSSLEKQAIRIFLAFLIMLVLAQFPPSRYQVWTPWLFLGSFFLLLAVLLLGVIGKGAQRWLNLWIFQFQPSELMKLTVPMMLAWFLHSKPLPPSFRTLLGSIAIIFIPAILIAKQPDLGTAILISVAGFGMLLLAGIHTRLIFSFLIISAASAPLLWHFMHQYQRDRVLTFLNPEHDPLGKGYHIIQSKIAIGSGGMFGKGWLNGTQSHLQFLPEHATDFIFAVCGEEFGFIGSVILLTMYLIIVIRGLYISLYAQDTFSRLLAGGLTLTLFISVFVNIGMVTGILPVVGIPLPFVSYGGTSFITFIASFGILMSIHTHRKLLGS